MSVTLFDHSIITENSGSCETAVYVESDVYRIGVINKTLSHV